MHILSTSFGLERQKNYHHASNPIFIAVIAHTSVFVILLATNDYLLDNCRSQTAWWYQRFLLDFSSAASASGAPQQRQRLTKGTGDDDGDGLRNEERWRTHLGNLRELVQDEENCKWAWLGILQVLDRISGTTGGNGEEEESNKKNERRSILGKLIIIDPHRKERYKQMLSRY